MKFIKYTLITIISIFTFIILLPMVVGYKADNSGEDFKREQIALKVRLELETYHKIQGQYPISLLKLPITTNKEFQSYYKEHIIRYKIDNTKSYYRLIWVFEGALKYDKGIHNTSWSGKQYSNKSSMLELMGENAKSDKNGFYIIDLH